MSIISKKICLVGDFGVGKTSLIRRFIEQRFSDQYLSTIGVSISRKQVAISTQEDSSEQTVQLLIWDIEGKTKFQEISPTYLKSAHGVIIVADSNRPETLENISSHINLAFSANPQGISISIVFNKVDLVAQDHVEILVKQHQFFNNSHVIPTYCTSAKTGENVEKMFYQLAQSMTKKS
ncbi:MAG: Rab family GTPase [Cyanobacteria bacterium P01_G01_bin.49]